MYHPSFVIHHGNNHNTAYYRKKPKRSRGINKVKSVLDLDQSWLLQETRIKWVQTTTAADRIINRIKEIVNDNVIFPVVEQLNRVWEALVGTKKDTEQYTGEKYAKGKGYADKKAKDANDLYEEKKENAYEKVKGEM
ncbi:hypothetical protein GYMLUDRAFT_1012615 [Collybiopsis luxurians FD-317 M1]|uniref:Uncharacterized protein n=1 Tax=Collybiopsis luxurians FD-317 M1 TaxID=944289 RepID=A0A0D0BNN2_9AGAR|nr:hypothetical protein GYMLUDRAFT_1012615 [Collybiopsis luxurians FD-317 M1]